VSSVNHNSGTGKNKPSAGAGATTTTTITTFASGCNSKQLDVYIKNLEGERDFYKNEIETLRELLRATQYECDNLKSRQTSPCHHHHSSHTPRKDSFSSNGGGKKAKSISPSVNVRSTTTTTTRCSVCSNRISYSNSNLAAELNGLGDSAEQKRAGFEEIRKLKRERDELKVLLDKFEKHMEEVCCCLFGLCFVLFELNLGNFNNA
jgi:hypothetical protein